METSLHRALEPRYASATGGRSEVTLEGFRIDAVDETGLLVEVQSGPLGPLRSKLVRLLPHHRIRVVKPIVVAKRVVRRSRAEGPDLSARRSPKRGSAIDVFEELVGLARIFPNPNLAIEVLEVSIDEIRIPRRRWPGYRIVDRCLTRSLGASVLERSSDLWNLLPGEHDWNEPFTTSDIASRTDRPLWFAQRVAYCLRHSGAVLSVGKKGTRGSTSPAKPRGMGRGRFRDCLAGSRLFIRDEADRNRAERT